MKIYRHRVLRLATFMLATIVLVTSFVASSVYAAKNKPRDVLEQGTILYQFFQKDYFEALVEDAYQASKNNPLVVNEEGTLLKGGMMLSYGVPNEADKIFSQLLDHSESEITKNSAWYYLAKLFYTKFDHDRARKALGHIEGKISSDIHIDYHYLATLIKNDGAHLEETRRHGESIKRDLPQYPYFLFNFAISQLRAGHESEAIKQLSLVVDYSFLGEEYEVLADRAKHALALIASQKGDFLKAWTYLNDVRTTGLYSNRALLSYAWSAINLKNYTAAVPALDILDKRSIAIPEVQESKVLLAHLYEQDGLKRKALKQHILAEKAFAEGLSMLAQARQIILHQDVPREFISNLETVVRDTDWYGARPDVDYTKLTPFLIDLLSSNSFQETLRELADLYAISDNLNYWLLQFKEHRIILKETKKKQFTSDTRQYIERGYELADQLDIKKSEFKLLTLTLDEKDRSRFKSIIDNTEKELELTKRNIKSLQSIKKPYIAPTHLQKDINLKEIEVNRRLKQAHDYIAKLEKVIRALVSLELDKHESRMSYYGAQSRLAKARLYDATLTTLEQAQQRVKSTRDEPSDKKKSK